MMPDRACKLFARWLIVMFVSLVALATCSGCFADVVNHREQQRAYTTQVNNCLAEFNVTVEFNRRGTFAVEGLTQSTPDIIAECGLKPGYMFISFPLPLTRTDGSPLGLEDIDYVGVFTVDKDGNQSEPTLKEVR